MFCFHSGSAYNGLRLATNHEVVVVTINYRLGVFGFLSNLTESFSANLGLQDQHMALNWIKDNIKVSKIVHAFIETHFVCFKWNII